MFTGFLKYKQLIDPFIAIVAQEYQTLKHSKNMIKSDMDKKEEPWWKKHTAYKSDKIIKMVENSPEEFMISRTEILQLVMDFKTLKNRFSNICMFSDAAWDYQDEWDSLTDEEKKARRAEYDKAEEMLKEIFDNQ